MLIIKILFRIAVGTFVLAGLDSGRATLLFAQEVPAIKGPSPKQPGTDEKLTAQELRGEGTYFQFCALCHVPRKQKTGSPATLGPLHAGLLKNAAPEKERAVREFIWQGTQNMPGYQYMLTSQELDDVIAYLKTR